EPMSSIFSAAMREWRRSLDSPALRHAAGSVRNRIERSMETTMGRETSRLERYMIFLATAGSVAPFVGLFGTVWGIMNSFRSIAATQNTTLVTVAPGIAEALFATALGLAVAIPAVVAYNKLGQDIARYAARLDDFTSEFSAILSRRIEESE
ncbi:MAG: MotA/TolQ/ExbB proton channel family protein, partial [Alphaproteobacteria bacterium]